MIVAGLDATFERRPFGTVASLLPLAEKVDKLSAICAYCSLPASFSQRLTSEVRLVEIGGSDKYCAVCRKHYFSSADENAE